MTIELIDMAVRLEDREDAHVLNVKKLLGEIFPNSGNDYGSTVYDKEGNAWGPIVVMKTYWVKHSTGEVTTRNPESYT